MLRANRTPGSNPGRPNVSPRERNSRHYGRKPRQTTGAIPTAGYFETGGHNG
jgi:hypothetical protein